MKAVSFRDVLAIPAFKGVRELDLLAPEFDNKVKEYLHIFGIDTRLPIEIRVAIHRDMHNKVGIGYQYLGEIRQDREFLNSKWCEIVDKVHAAAMQDPSLGREMCELLNKTIDYKSVSELPDEEWQSDEGVEVDPEYERNVALIKQLESIRDIVRGKQSE